MKIALIVFAVMFSAACVEAEEPTTGTASSPLTWQDCQRDPDACHEWMNTNGQDVGPSWSLYDYFTDEGGFGVAGKPPIGSLWIRTCKSCSRGGEAICKNCCLFIVFGSGNDASYCTDMLATPGDGGLCRHQGALELPPEGTSCRITNDIWH